MEVDINRNEYFEPARRYTMWSVQNDFSHVWDELHYNGFLVNYIIFNLLCFNVYVVLKIFVILYNFLVQATNKVNNEKLMLVEAEMKDLKKRIKYLEDRNSKRETPHRNKKENIIVPPVPPPLPTKLSSNNLETIEKSPIKTVKSIMPIISVEDIKNIKLRKTDKIVRHRAGYLFVSPRNVRHHRSMSRQLKSPVNKDGSAFNNARKRFMSKSPKNDLERYLKNIDGYPMYDIKK